MVARMGGTAMPYVHTLANSPPVAVRQNSSLMTKSTNWLFLSKFLPPLWFGTSQMPHDGNSPALPFSFEVPPKSSGQPNEYSPFA